MTRRASNIGGDDVPSIKCFGMPADTLPGWTQPAADDQLFTVVSNAVRSLTLGGADAADLGHSTTSWVVLSLAWYGGILAAFSAIAVSRFARPS
jgi:hypothetical protein